MAPQKFRVIVRPSVYDDLKKVDLRYHAKIWDDIDALGDNPFPRGCVKIKDGKGVFRIRVGVFRIFYKASKKQRIVFVDHVQHRQSSYKKK